MYIRRYVILGYVNFIPLREIGNKGDQYLVIVTNIFPTIPSIKDVLGHKGYHLPNLPN